MVGGITAIHRVLHARYPAFQVPVTTHSMATDQVLRLLPSSKRCVQAWVGEQLRAQSLPCCCHSVCKWRLPERFNNHGHHVGARHILALVSPSSVIGGDGNASIQVGLHDVRDVESGVSLFMHVAMGKLGVAQMLDSQAERASSTSRKQKYIVIRELQARETARTATTTRTCSADAGLSCRTELAACALG